MARIVSEVRPSFVFVENSPLLVGRGLARILGDLAAMGYDAVWGVVGACDVGAPHIRKRIWILAYASSTGLAKRKGKCADDGKECKTFERTSYFWQDVADANNSKATRQNDCSENWWSIEPGICRIFNELAEKLDQIIFLTPTNTPLYNAVKGGISHEKKGQLFQDLLPLRECFETEILRHTLRRFNDISKKKVLQQTLHGKGDDKRRSKKINVEQKSKQTKKTDLPDVRSKEEFMCASRGWQPCEQQVDKYNDALFILPYGLALAEREETSQAICEIMHRLRTALTEMGFVPKTLSEAEKAWRSFSDKEKDWVGLRISSGNPWCEEWLELKKITNNEIPNRTERIRALGEGQVPLCAAVAWRLLCRLACNKPQNT